MQLKKHSIRDFLLKLTVRLVSFSIIAYVSIIILSTLFTAFLFFMLNNHKDKVENLISTYFGYSLKTSNITTTLNKDFLPELVIDNMQLHNLQNSQESLSINQVKLVLSYSSLWHLSPTFKKIEINGSTINMEYLKNNSILINGIVFNNESQSDFDTTKIEKWLLQQKQIRLNNIDFNFIDQKHNLSAMNLKNISIKLKNKTFHRHAFTINIAEKTQTRLIGLYLNWKGGILSQFQQWPQASLKIQIYENKSPITNLIQQYLPNFNKQFALGIKTALDVQMINGKLQSLYANFDIKNLQYSLEKNNHHFRIPKLGGTIVIDLVNNSYYKLKAHNLTISTPNGYILGNKNITDITGYYEINKKGSLDILKTDLTGFNHLLSLLSINNIKLSGEIDIFNLNFVGNIFNPLNYSIYSKFTNVTINSTNPNIPSIDKISGTITASESSGKIDLNLNNSTMKYKKIFRIPYVFNQLNTNINWKINPDKTINVTLPPTNIITPDFTGNVSGTYVYTPGSIGYINLHANVPKVPLVKVAGYLPINIGKKVHDWLDMAIQNGYGTDATLHLQGNLADFPYESGNGIFHINANVNNGKLQYVKDWPTIDDINGTFEIKNTQINIQADTATLMDNNLYNAYVNIPNMLSKDISLIADGKASGLTSKFLDYLTKTPISAMIGDIPKEVTAKGSGLAKIHLAIPLNNLDRIKVSGEYEFKNNQLKFNKLPIPELHNTNGVLYFSQNGVEINKIVAKSLDSDFILKAATDSKGTMDFNVFTPNLDYKQALLFYVPLLSSVTAGRSSSKINFSIAKTGLTKIIVTSKLTGVSIDVPLPLKKESMSESSIEIAIYNDNSSIGSNIKFNYNKQNFGNLLLDKNGSIQTGQIAIGNDNLVSQTGNNAKLIINVNLPDIYTLDWINTIKQMVNAKALTNQSVISNSTNKATSSNLEQNNISNKKQIANSNDVFPIEILVNSPNLYFSTLNFHKVNANILVQESQTIFNINNDQANGYGVFIYESALLNINLNDLSILSSITEEEIIKKNNLLAKKLGIPVIKLSDQSFVIEGLNNLKSQKALVIESDNLINYLSNFPSDQSGTNTLEFPNIKLKVKNLSYENHTIGQFSVSMRPSGNDLLIEDGNLLDPHNKITNIQFHGRNYCMQCGESKSFVQLNVKANIIDLGLLLENLNYGKIVSKGSGEINASIQWIGTLQSFNKNNIIATIDTNLKSGKFLKVYTGNFFGTLIGLINLQTLVNLMSFNFSEIFENGFYFDKLKIQAFLLNNKINLRNLTMNGPQAVVLSDGSIDIENDLLDLSLSVMPSLGLGVAIGAAAATGFNPIIGPIVGVAVYAMELILGNPFNKLFTFSFNITGTLQKPNVKSVKASKQILNNINSAIQN